MAPVEGRGAVDDARAPPRCVGRRRCRGARARRHPAPLGPLASPPASEHLQSHPAAAGPREDESVPAAATQGGSQDAAPPQAMGPRAHLRLGQPGRSGSDGRRARKRRAGHRVVCPRAHDHATRVQAAGALLGVGAPDESDACPHDVPARASRTQPHTSPAVRAALRACTSGPGPTSRARCSAGGLG